PVVTFLTATSLLTALEHAHLYETPSLRTVLVYFISDAFKQASCSARPNEFGHWVYSRSGIAALCKLPGRLATF
ncbi:hypothetical protein, partial [Pseudomonas syringae]|uniref:hypothetical protein n=1 Tax=Pseudomonas syringae TaxID=317 RepID=UPI001CA47DAA